MLGRGRAEEGGGGGVRSGGGAGVVYWGARGIDRRESVGGGLREEDRGRFTCGVGSGRSFRGNVLRGGVCECAARPGIRGFLSTERERIGAAGRRNGDRTGQVPGSRRGSGEGRKDFMGVDGRGMRYWRRGVESAREARRESGERVNRACAHHRTARNGSTEGRPLHGSAYSGCQLLAPAGRRGFLERERRAWALKPCAIQLLRQFGHFAKRTRRRRPRF